MKAAGTTLSNNILHRAKKEHIDITPMKLQKLLYYVCVKYAKEMGISPISEPFEVWKYGPVLNSVYTEFKPFGAQKITKYAKNAAGTAMMVNESLNPFLRQCLDYVWNNMKQFSGVELSRRTHRPESGWYAAYQRDDSIITLEDMEHDGTI